MRLDFTILWIDDQQKHVKSFSEGLKIRLRELGFDLYVLPVESLDKVDAAVGAHVQNDAVDLVLVDYDLGLGSGDGGEQALSKVRKQFPYKEVLFYSATDTEKLRKIAYDAKIDGIYFSTRFSLVNDAAHIINKLLNKVLDLDHMRGVVMSASSDIDYLVENSLAAVYGRLDSEKKSEFVKNLVEDIEKKLKNWNADLEKASRTGDLGPILKLKHLYSAFDRLGSLIDQLGSWETEHSTYLDKVKQYKEDIVPKRNKLAHLMLKRQQGQLPQLAGVAGSWNIEDMTKLRCDLIEHRENFQDIAVLVDVKLE
jgi:DNA-binding NarL/FixJ family response regulator